MCGKILNSVSYLRLLFCIFKEEYLNNLLISSSDDQISIIIITNYLFLFFNQDYYLGCTLSIMFLNI